MNIKYQLVILGKESQFRDSLLESINTNIKKLGIKSNSFKVINEDNFSTEYKGNAPIFCIYFGSEDIKDEDVGFLKTLISASVSILPIVENLNKYKELTPVLLHPINGKELTKEEEINSIASIALEGLGLLRATRKIFISYRRDESKSVAIQLFEKLESVGFNVFLDTHSVPKAHNFQEELWHQMTDSDVVIMLDTPNFRESEWTTQELAEANSMSIGILQVIWANHERKDDTKLSIPLMLNKLDFINNIYDDANNSKLNSDILDLIVQNVESLRARTIASRRSKIISEFKAYADNLDIKMHLRYDNKIVVSREESYCVLIPYIGVPQSKIFHEAELFKQTLDPSTKVNLLYDKRNIRKNWIDHLDWLNCNLPINSLSITDTELWLKKN